MYLVLLSIKVNDWQVARVFFFFFFLSVVSSQQYVSESVADRSWFVALFTSLA